MPWISVTLFRIVLITGGVEESEEQKRPQSRVGPCLIFLPPAWHRHQSHGETVCGSQEADPRERNKGGEEGGEGE